jgi:4-amino-4-deoxy-L-arabinose transferase-like glycosyltransferase
LQNSTDTNNSLSLLILGTLTCIAILLVRLTTLPLIDLIDSTEGRYAAAAVTMVEKGDYLTPWIDMGKGPEPYLGKPPMHFWITIGAYKVFGISPFSARVPSYLATLLTALMIVLFARRIWGWNEGLASALLFLSCGLTFFLGGAAVLDTTLMLFDTAAILLFGGYYLCGLNSRPRVTSILIGTCLSGAFLTKGPVGLAIFIAAVIPWACIHRKDVFSKKFPLLLCILTFIALTMPWYLLCEIYHPGFLYYFIVKENILRIVSDNYGDRYGSGHPQTFGMSFLHAFLSFMPWSLALLGIGISTVKNRTTSIRTALYPSSLEKMDPALLFLGLWSLSMPAFLLLTSQYTANYLAPSMPAFALLLGVLVMQKKELWNFRISLRGRNVLLIAAAAIYILLPIIGMVLGGDWWILPVCALLAGLMYCLAKTFQSSTPLHSIVSGAGMVTVLYAVVIISLSSYISSRRSTGEIFALLRKQIPHSQTAPIKVGFFGQPPFSSAVYSTIYQPRVELRVVSTFEDDSNLFSEYYIASKKMTETLNPPPTIVEISRTRKWVLFKRELSLLK